MASAVVAIAIGIGALTGRDDDVNVTTKPEPSTTAPDADDDAVEPFKPAAPGSVVLTPPPNDTQGFELVELVVVSLPTFRSASRRCRQRAAGDPVDVEGRLQVVVVARTPARKVKHGQHRLQGIGGWRCA